MEISAERNKRCERENMEENITYEQSGLDGRILRAVAELGFESMTPIQEQAIPVFLEGKDLIGQAQTGTGKTAAFGIPILQMVEPEEKSLQALILCPTRELAIQAADEIRKFGKYMEGVKVLPIYGGQDINKQIRSLKGNVQIVVGTPGRVMDHMRRHTLKLGNLKMIVLDEADEMLNMGFREDIETILKDIPGDHQTGLFSATMPKPILDITKTYQKPDAVMVKIAAKELTIPLVRQYYYEVRLKNKEEVTARILDYYNPKRTLIFCNTKRKVDELAEVLKGRGYFAEGFHGDMTQAQRDKIMNGFRKGYVDILIATDVAARGIDVDDVEAVFNYDIPQDIEYYVHRIGRTGRAGKTGRAFTLVVGRDIYKIRDIERVCRTKIKPRTVPLAADINNARADKIIREAVEYIKDEKIYKMLKIVESRLDDEDFTAIELAAALLKMHMGKEVEDMKLDYSWFDSDEYKERKRRKKESERRDDKSSRKRDNKKQKPWKRDEKSKDYSGREDKKKDRRSDDRKDIRKEKKSDDRKDNKKDKKTIKNVGKSDDRKEYKKDRKSDGNRSESDKNDFRKKKGKRESGKSVKRDAYGNRIPIWEQEKSDQ